MADDAVDVALAAAGDGAAFERLYKRHVPRIHALSLRMGPSGDAEELTQEIFIRVWQKLGSFKGNAAFGTWLYRLGINLILTRRQSSSRRRQYEVEADELIEQVPAGITSSPAMAERAMDFERALRELPEGAKEVLILHDVEGFKHQEIAGLLDISAGTSKSQLHRARMLMRKVLKS